MFFLVPAVMLLLGSSSAKASAELPKPSSNGDYTGRTSHKFWVVVDPDPQGVNCRWSTSMPVNWYSPEVKLPLVNIDQWPVVRRFKRNEAVTSNLTPAGFAFLFDDRNKPWLKVSIGPKEQICLIRANSKFIQPFQK